MATKTLDFERTMNVTLGLPLRAPRRITAWPTNRGKEPGGSDADGLRAAPLIPDPAPHDARKEIGALVGAQGLRLNGHRGPQEVRCQQRTALKFRSLGRVAPSPRDECSQTQERLFWRRGSNSPQKQRTHFGIEM